MIIYLVMKENNDFYADGDDIEDWFISPDLAARFIEKHGGTDEYDNKRYIEEVNVKESVD